MTHISRSCTVCATEFSISRKGRGIQKQIYCSRRCNKIAAYRRERIKNDARPLCSVEGCEEKAKRKNARLCEKHYTRLRRNGHLEIRPKAEHKLTTTGYLLVSAPTHPIAKNGMAYQHRIVLYDIIGPGKHNCHWCCREIEWGGDGGRALIADHLNAIKIDNAPQNLVPSCYACNTMRGAFMCWIAAHRDDPLLQFDPALQPFGHALSDHSSP